mmetsp:Transcript_57758/g.161072  ORF Transcript_57758/g.161072 Transcript_57758/m.161072 type:complete len:236 (+) Transcript_57758:926-1633(+)
MALHRPALRGRGGEEVLEFQPHGAETGLLHLLADATAQAAGDRLEQGLHWVARSQSRQPTARGRVVEGPQRRVAGQRVVVLGHALCFRQQAIRRGDSPTGPADLKGHVLADGLVLVERRPRIRSCHEAWRHPRSDGGEALTKVRASIRGSTAGRHVFAISARCYLTHFHDGVIARSWLLGHLAVKLVQTVFEVLHFLRGSWHQRRRVAAARRDRRRRADEVVQKFCVRLLQEEHP